MISPHDFNFCLDLARRFLAPPPLDQPDDWAAREVIFNEQQVKGRCDFTGRNYLRRPIRDNNDPRVRKQTLVFGRGTGKTLTRIIGLMFKLKFIPGTRSLNMFPATNGEGGSKNFATTRFIEDLKSTPAISALFPPGGQERMFMNAQRIRVNGSHIGFVGSNSPGQAVSNRLSDIGLDELEKFKMKLGNEAGAQKLIEGSTEGVTDYQIFQTSTPSIDGGLIWQSLIKSDFRLRFLPCPHCSSLAKTEIEKHGALNGTPPPSEAQLEALARMEKFKGWFILAWSERFAEGLPKKFRQTAGELKDVEIPMAFVTWPKDCKSASGVWNLERVKRETAFQCPHCKQFIRDITLHEGQIRIAPAQKNWMDAHGFWLATQDGEPNHAGYQLGSLYAPVINEESTIGGRAVKFLSACEEGGEAVRDFINAILGLAELGQGGDRVAIELNSAAISQPDWVALLTADFQKNWPYIWFIVRRWCAFKLLPPFGLSNGLPDFLPLLELADNAGAKKICAALVSDDPAKPVETLKAASPAALYTLAELMRFKSGEARSPLIDFLLAQKITGSKLVKLHREEAGGNTLEFRAAIYKLMGLARPPRGGDSELIACGSLDTSGARLWDDLRAVEDEFKVGAGLTLDHRCAAIDTGFAEELHREVQQQIYERADHYKWYDPTSSKDSPVFHGLWQKGEQKAPARHRLCLPCAADGWIGVKGIPTNRPLGSTKINYDVGLRVEDPYYGTPEQGRRVIEVLQIPQVLFWLRKNDLRQGRTRNAYAISPQVSFFPKQHLTDGTRTGESPFKLADYERQMNEQIFSEEKRQVVPRHGKGGAQGRKFPYHLDDCETYQIALATHHGFFETGNTNGK